MLLQEEQQLQEQDAREQAELSAAEAAAELLQADVAPQEGELKQVSLRLLEAAGQPGPRASDRNLSVLAAFRPGRASDQRATLAPVLLC